MIQCISASADISNLAKYNKYNGKFNNQGKIWKYLAALPNEVNATIAAALTLTAARTFRKEKDVMVHQNNCMKRKVQDHENRLHDLTADDAIDSACDIGC